MKKMAAGLCAMTITALSVASWNVFAVGEILAEEPCTSSEEERVCSAKFKEYTIDWSQSENCITIALTNGSSSFALSDWTLVYNCDAAIISADGAEVINGKGVHHLKSCQNNSVIEPGKTCTIYLTIDSEEMIDEPEDYAVYFQYDSEEETYEECTDYITVDLATGDMSAHQSDGSAMELTDQTAEQGKSVGYNPNALRDDTDSIEPVYKKHKRITQAIFNTWMSNGWIS